MMIRAVNNSVTKGQYFYDGDGKRVKGVETNTKVYSYVGLNMIYEKDVTANSITKYFYANGLLVAKLTGLATEYFHHDNLGSTRLTTTGTKVVQFSTNYRPFGPQWGTSGSEKVKYTGKYEDSATKLYYFGARYYDPAIGRFTTQDPLISFTEPSALNRYVYAANNPLKFIDPTGLYYEYWDYWDQPVNSNPTPISTYDSCSNPYDACTNESPALPSEPVVPIPTPAPAPTAPSPPYSPVTCVYDCATEPQKPTTAEVRETFTRVISDDGEAEIQSPQEAGTNGNSQIVTFGITRIERPLDPIRAESAKNQALNVLPGLDSWQQQLIGLGLILVGSLIVGASLVTRNPNGIALGIIIASNGWYLINDAIYNPSGGLVAN